MKTAFTILGEPASKANSRELATIGPKDNRRTILRKSDKALDYEHSALKQIPPRARQRLEGPVRVTMRIYYASERPDLDESVILDVLQDRYAKDPITGERKLVQHGVYRNDRQVRSKRVDWALDRVNPRAEIIVEPLQPQQVDLLPDAEPEPLPKKRQATKKPTPQSSQQKVSRETTPVDLEDQCPF
jgi:hypothetical protein